MRSQYQTLVQERNAVLAENGNLNYQFNAIQTTYLVEEPAAAQG